ncbi:hypothetical protein, partial [Butyricicoccus pullicaecorum]|uniref:hypothetical protein n=1 Tax=Butyricicoccus pullicaecorum TaxID=501571 RepID=UPI001951E2A0
FESYSKKLCNLSDFLRGMLSSNRQLKYNTTSFSQSQQVSTIFFARKSPDALRRDSPFMSAFP